MKKFRWLPTATTLPMHALAGILVAAACAGNTRGGRLEGVVPVSVLDAAAAGEIDPVPARGIVPVTAVASSDTLRRCRTVRTPRGQQVQCAIVGPVAEPTPPVATTPDLPPALPPALQPTPGTVPVTPTTVVLAEALAPRTPVMDAAKGGDEGPMVTVNFLGDPLADVLSLFSAQSGRSIIASDDKDVVSKKISGDIRNQPWRTALDLLMRSHGLRVSEDSSSGVLSVLSQSQSLTACLPRVMRLEYAYAEDLVPVIQDLMGIGKSGGSGDQAGCDRAEVVATGNKDGKSSTFVIFTTDDRMGELQSLIQQLDIRKPMVGIQVKMVFVNRSKLQKFGWQYTLTNQGSLTGGNNSGNGAVNGMTGVQVSPFGGGLNQQNSAGGGTGRPFTVLQRLALGGATSLNVFVEAMQSVGLAQTDAQPMIVTQSEATANISVGEFFILPQTQPLVAGGAGGGQGVGTAGGGQVGGTGSGGQVGPVGTNPGGGGVGVTNQGLSNPAFGFAQFQTGTVLKVTPQVLSTGEIRVDVEVSRDGGNLGSNGQGLSGARQFASTNVIVKNGEDIPIGGMRVLSRSTTKGGIPVLSSIPLLGRLFRTNEDAELFQDLMIIVTPTIIE